MFVLLLPALIRNINQDYTDSRLRKQRDKVIQIVKNSGIKTYIQNGESYGSYNALLKEEYVSIDEEVADVHVDAIKNERRLIEGDTIQYRILSYTFMAGKKNYLLEIGKSTDSVKSTVTHYKPSPLSCCLG